ncbi:FAD-dependent oxidoreductase [Halorussus salinus]|uniref:FAD-dependent oxidoreductase n=1 Tax=Halorussus salinus TaxID=1364935 RepID=UPI001093231F|nr:FAD-dependent monooxygenase [Halorussus salinus]
MSLSTVARYDDGRLARTDDEVVVVGASMAGLLAGRVLADYAREVTILDKDPLPDESVARRGVRQAEHVHVMLEAGRATLEDLFPGFSEELLSAGGLVVDGARDVRQHQEGDFLADGRSRFPLYCASRPLFERVVRRRVAERPNVTLRPNCTFTGYRHDEEARRVTGATVADEGGETTALDADLVVDATGRTSRTPDWLAANGYESPAAEEVTVDLAYSTVAVERPPDDRRALLVSPSPPVTRGGTAVPVEDDRWIVTLFGLHGDHPPADPGGVETFAEGLPTPELAALLADHEWVSDEVHQYPFPASVRRRYDEVGAFPDGLVVLGDAIASFNPIYGQGMSVAALEAVQLHHALAEGGRADLAPRFFEKADAVVDSAWKIAAGADFDFPQTEGPEPAGAGLLNRYVSRLVRTAHDDPKVAERFGRVIRLERSPTALVAPDVLLRVLAPASVRRFF